MTGALLRRRWLPLATVALLVGLLGVPMARELAAILLQSQTGLTASLADWLIEAALEAVFLLGLLVVLRPWPVRRPRSASIVRWAVALFLLQAVASAPLMLAPEAVDGPKRSVTFEITEAGESISEPVATSPSMMVLAAVQSLVALALILAPAAVVLEDRDAISAARRSLTCWRHGWRALLAMLASLGAVLLALAIVQTPDIDLPWPASLDPQSVVATVLASLFCSGLLLQIRVMTEPQPEVTAEVFD